MTTNRSRSAALGAVLGLATLAAVPTVATAHRGHSHAPRQQSVAIRFAAVAGSYPVSCTQPIEALGTTRQTARLLDLRFFVSKVQLLRRDGRAVTVRLRADSPYRVTSGKDAVTLIDLEDGRGTCEGGTRGTNAFVRGTVPRGEYVGARWTVGVPFALNHTDATTAPAPLNSAAMAWSWQVGRKFTKIEVTDPGTPGAAPWSARTFFVHLGSTGCTGNPATGETARCADSNRAEVSLARFNPARQDVAVDLKALTAGSDITQNGGGAPGCMSAGTDPECGPVFRALGLRLPAGGGMDMGDGGMDMGGMSAQAAAAAKQTVFRPLAR